MKENETEGKVKNPGQMISFMDQETIDIQHRNASAWSAFARHRQQLPSKVLPAPTQATFFFDSVVTPTTMHGAKTWATTEEYEHMIHDRKQKRLRGKSCSIW